MKYFIYPELLTEKNIALSTYKKYLIKMPSNFMYTRNFPDKFSTTYRFIVYRNKRIKQISNTLFNYDFNKNGEFVSLRKQNSRLILFKSDFNVTCGPNSGIWNLPYEFRKTMKDHGIITIFDYFKEENTEIVDFYWNMFKVGNMEFPFELSEKTLERTLYERECKEIPQIEKL